LIAADVYRPAAIDQLETLGGEQNIPVFSRSSSDPIQVAKDGLGEARKAGASVVILDTAGRSQLDQEMMLELQHIDRIVQPVETLLVADAMTGQEAIRIAEGFQNSLNLTGLILTKMDGDARGGAAISMRAVTGVPIKYIGTGEAREALEAFEPARLASRILGMGDMISLIEKAESTFDQQQAEQQVDRLMKGDFTFEDFASQLAQVEKLGPLGSVMEMLPSNVAGAGVQLDEVKAEKQLKRTRAMIQSMTKQERRKPAVLNASRKRRIAAGSGTTVQEVNQLLRQFKQMQKMFKQMNKRGMGGILPGLR
jgi:signal recognition particle subunit SRP54